MDDIIYNPKHLSVDVVDNLSAIIAKECHRVNQAYKYVSCNSCPYKLACFAINKLEILVHPSEKG